MKGFEIFLRDRFDNSTTTVYKHYQRFTRILNIAMQKGFMDRHPFPTYKIRMPKKKIEYLTQEELDRIVGTNFSIERINTIRDIFVFCCYSGYAYVDVANLTHENLRKGIDGNLWVYSNREKTSTKSNVPLLPKALEIIEKYKDHPAANYKGTLLPTLSNQKMNAFLKEIAIIAKINKHLTFHLARHTFATLMLTKGVSIETVAEMLGHQDIRTTQIYAKVVEKKVSEEMNLVKRRLRSEESPDNQKTKS